MNAMSDLASPPERGIQRQLWATLVTTADIRVPATRWLFLGEAPAGFVFPSPSHRNGASYSACDVHETSC
jgi:hypothetical protein